jgi:hypothetical protein
VRRPVLRRHRRLPPDRRACPRAGPQLVAAHVVETATGWPRTCTRLRAVHPRLRGGALRPARLVGRTPRLDAALRARDRRRRDHRATARAGSGRRADLDALERWRVA